MEQVAERLRKAGLHMSADSVWHIAQVCHTVNRAYCESLGDFTQVPWAQAPRWQQDSAFNGVMFVLENPGVSPAQQHGNWMAEKARDGWTYGPEKDPEKKTHPCMVSYDQLPREQQTKDFLFRAVVDAMRW